MPTHNHNYTVWHLYGLSTKNTVLFNLPQHFCDIFLTPSDLL